MELYDSLLLLQTLLVPPFSLQFWHELQLVQAVQFAPLEHRPAIEVFVTKKTISINIKFKVLIRMNVNFQLLDYDFFSKLILIEKLVSKSK